MSGVSVSIEQGGVAERRRRRSALVREHAWGYALTGPSVILLAVLIVYPALKSFWDTLAVQHVVMHHGVQSVVRAFSFDIYQQVWNSKLDQESIIYTVRVTVITVAVLFLIAYPLAMYLRFSRGRIPSLVRTIALIPLFVPTIISAYAFISFYQQGNFLDVLLQDLNLEQTIFGGRFPQLIDNTTGIVLGLVWNSIPITVLLIAAGLGEIDTALIESARDIGAGYFRIFRAIIFPLALRQTLIAFALACINVIGSYNIPDLLGRTRPQMLGPLMDDNVVYQHVLWAEAEAVISFVFAALVGVLYIVALYRQRWR